ncbi:MAG: HAD family hydrolase, partial [Acidimicrobiales bacterium]
LSLLRTIQGVGVPFLVATARTPRAIRKIPDHQSLGRMVCANGAIVWDADRDDVVSERPFEPAALAAAVARVRRALPECGVALLSAQTMFLDQAYLALRAKRGDDATVFSDLDRLLATERIVMVAVRHLRLRAEQFVASVAEAFAGVGCASFAGAGTVDVAPDDTTKALAVAAVMREVGCSPEAAVVFGDMPNDLPLFACSGWACAVSNGHPSVLVAADEIVASNDQNGVALTVRRLFGLV